MHYSSLFQYFLLMCYGPYSSWKIQIFLCTCLLLTYFVNNYYDWWTHAYRIWNGAACPSYINYRLKSEVSITLHCRLCSTRYTAVRIKNCSKSTSAIKIATMKNTDNLHYEGKPSRTTAKSTLFAVNKYEWDTKEDTGKSMKNALYILQHAKRHLSGQSNVEQWKNEAHSRSCYWVTLVWRHQSVSYSVCHSVSRKFL